LSVPPIRDDGLLEGLGEIPWADLSHAYGPAEDVPGLLRAIASGDAEAAKSAAHELYGNIWHQGTVYEATSHAVPFLARMAAAGVASGDLAYLLGFVAESRDDAHLAVPGSARAAVAAQAGLLAPLLQSPDGQVRMAVAWALAQSGPAEDVLPALRAQWDVEEVPSIRATLLKAMSVLDPPQAASIALRVLASGTPGERFIAAWACVAAGLPWTSEVSEATAAWLADGLNLDPSWWVDQHDGPVAGLLIELAMRGDLDVATEFSIEYLGQAARPQARADVAWAAGQLATRYRVPGRELAAALVPAIADESSRRNALWLLRRLDLRHIASSGSFGALADALFAAADTHSQDLTANDALACLFALGDARATGLLARDLPHRVELMASGGSLQFSGHTAALAFDQRLLDAIRGVLGTGGPHAGSLLPGRPAHLRHNALIRILDLLASWGPAAVPAIPEVITILPGATFPAARALAAIAGPAPEAIRTLRAAAEATAGGNGIAHRIQAASTLRDLTRDTGPLLAAIRDGLGGQRGHDHAARAARSIEDPPGWLVPVLEAALAASGEDKRPRAEVTWTLCRLAPGADAVLPVMTELLQQSPYGLGGPVGGYAVLEAACELGLAAGPLVPELARFLPAPVFCPIAAEAILRAGLGEISLSTLADHLVRAVGADGGRNHKRALDVLREVRLLDHAAISPSALGRLSDLAERSARVSCSGAEDDIIRSDEELRRMIRSFLGETATRHARDGWHGPAGQVG
jgi:hypothetical protein